MKNNLPIINLIAGGLINLFLLGAICLTMRVDYTPLATVTGTVITEKLVLGNFYFMILAIIAAVIGILCILLIKYKYAIFFRASHLLLSAQLIGIMLWITLILSLLLWVIWGPTNVIYNVKDIYGA